MKRIFFLILGFLCVAAGIAGILLPLLPATPFLLAAALLFSRSSRRIYARMRANPYLNSFIEHYRLGLGVPRVIITRSLIVLWLSLGGSALFVREWWMFFLLAAIGIGVTAHLRSLRRSDRAPLRFTLIELLVSLGIIALLASLLLPVLNKAKTSAQRSVCMNNLRQIGYALQMYSGDNVEFLPSLAPGFDGSIMILRMPGAGRIGLGRLVGEYGTLPRTYGCPLNPTRMPAYMTSKWPGAGPVQAAYLFRSTDTGFIEKLYAPANNGKALVMDFCCILDGGTPIVAHHYEDVNILYTDNSVKTRKNSPEPKKLYTVSAPSDMFGNPTPECESAWQNADSQ